MGTEQFCLERFVSKIDWLTMPLCFILSCLPASNIIRFQMTSASRSTVRDDFVTFMLINILTANIYYFNNKKSTRVMCSAVLFIQLSYFFFAIWCTAQHLLSFWTLRLSSFFLSSKSPRSDLHLRLGAYGKMIIVFPNAPHHKMLITKHKHLLFYSKASTLTEQRTSRKGWLRF